MNPFQFNTHYNKNWTMRSSDSSDSDSHYSHQSNDEVSVGFADNDIDITFDLIDDSHSLNSMNAAAAASAAAITTAYLSALPPSVSSDDNSLFDPPLEFDDDMVDSDNIYNFYEICEYEDEFIDSEKLDGQYVIGLNSGFINDKFNDTFACGVSVQSFFRFPYISILYYLVYSSIFQVAGPKKIDIIKIHINSDNVYVSIIKTHWLRLIQRHWRTAFNERKTIIKMRGIPRNIFHFQYKGTYPDGLQILPSIRGLLSSYNSHY